MPKSTRFRTLAFTCAALVGFAGNSLLCRLALLPNAVDPSSFTSLRLCAGALTLFALVQIGPKKVQIRRAGTWSGALLLFLYAVAFSFAYVKLAVGTGALLLFGAVQTTMIGWGLYRGERPGIRVWIGMGIALSGLAALTFPGLAAPNPVAAASMLVAGVAWGFYSLLGRGAQHALHQTASNFIRSLPFTAAVSLATFSGAHASTRGVLLAVASGSLASGVGYSFWYAALPALSATNAAIAQLSVPILAAGGAVVFLQENLTLRVVAAGILMLAGVAIALGSSRNSRA